MDIGNSLLFTNLKVTSWCTEWAAVCMRCWNSSQIFLVLTYSFIIQDILHPLASLNWEEYGPWFEGSKIICINGESVLLNDKIYFAVQTKSEDITRGRYSSYIYAISTDFSSMTYFSLPDVSYFTLTTYNYKLVLVGGVTLIHPTESWPRNELWVSEDGTNWEHSLPPMPTHRYAAAVLSTDSPQYLIVAGGAGERYKLVDTVEVLADDQWFSLPPLPKPTNYGTSPVCLHNGNVYLMNINEETFYCNLESLLNCCNKARMHELDTNKELWNTTSNSLQSPISFGKQLVAMNLACQFCAYSTLSQSWALVGAIPSGGRPQTAIVLPTGELVLIGYDRMMKATIKSKLSSKNYLFMIMFIH